MKSRPLFFMSTGDPRDVSVFSGSAHFLWRALTQRYPEMGTIGRTVPAWYFQTGRVLRRLPPLKIDIGGWPRAMRAFGARVARRLPADAAIISLNNSPIVAALANDFPTLYVSDATYRGLRGLYGSSGGGGRLETKWFEESERLAIKRARHVSFSSPWGARSAIDEYGADPSRTSAVPWGCNFGLIPRTEPKTSTDGICRLLLPGREWFRKGVDIGIATLEALRVAGVPATLDVAGVEPPAGFVPPAGVTIHGLLRKSDPAEAERLAQLFGNADFLLLPTRADCTPMVFAEANAFGVPGITLDVGGVTGVIQHGLNGLVGRPEEGAAGLARLIADVWSDRESYLMLRRSAREMYERRLNWDAWIDTMSPVIEDLRSA